MFDDVTRFLAGGQTLVDEVGNLLAPASDDGLSERMLVIHGIPSLPVLGNRVL
jgi:hypothetical protein